MRQEYSGFYNLPVGDLRLLAPTMNACIDMLPPYIGKVGKLATRISKI